MKYFLSLAAACLCAVSLCASSMRDDLAVSLIPDSLLRGAHSIVRSSETVLEVSSASQAQLREHTVVTVLDEAAADALSVQLYYNRYAKIRDMKVSIYDRTGNLMNKHQIYDM